MPTPNLHIRIISPTQILYEGNALSVSSSNSTGKFDILAEHANFITLVENKPIIIRDLKQQPVTFTFALAIILTVKNSVNIYTHIQLQK